MGIQALPYLARIPPGLAISEGGAVTLGKEEVMPQAGYPWSAETMAEWVLDRSGVAVGEIKRPTLLSTRWGGWGAGFYSSTHIAPFPALVGSAGSCQSCP